MGLSSDESNDTYAGALKTTPSNSPSGGLQSIQNPNAFLQKLSELATPRQMGYSVAGGTTPQDVGGFFASKVLGRNSGVGGIVPQAEGMRQNEVNRIPDPILRGMTDYLTMPETWVLPVEGGVQGAEAIGNSTLTKTGRMNLLDEVTRQVKSAKPTASAEMGDELSALESMYPGKKVNFGGPIAKAYMDPNMQAILDEFPNIRDAQDLSLTDSQSMINDLRESFPQRVWNGKVKPSERHMLDLSDMLSGAQDEAFPEMADAVRPKYGVVAEAQKKVPNVLQAIAGKSDPMARDVQDEAMKVLIGNKQFNKIKGYRFMKGATGLASTALKLKGGSELIGPLFH